MYCISSKVRSSLLGSIFSSISDFYEQDMLGALEELLRGNQGRFAPFPFIKSALEVNIFKRLLQTKFGDKYKG